MSVTYYIYIVGLVLSTAYIVLSVVTELEFLLGKFTLPLPYGILAWSALGLWSLSEPIAFILGFILPYVSVFLLYSIILTDPENDDQFLLRHGQVTIPIYPSKKGEIRVGGNRGDNFFVAEAPHLTKPLNRQQEVMIIARDGNYVTVTDDLNYRKQTQQSWLHYLARLIIHPLLPRSVKSGICLVCYQQMVKDSDTLQCPECLGVAHYDHLSYWIKSRGFCPQCRADLFLNGSILYSS